MYRLEKSQDGGRSYHRVAKAATVEELLPTGKRFDQRGLRWFIKNEQGEIVEASAIHKGFLALMRTVNQDPE